MRPAQKSNRSRGRGNRKGSGGGNNVNRVYDSAGPEGKVRGTPQQIIEKYLTLARDAQTSGDRVAAENFLQHAEHYQRILITANAAQEQARKENQESAPDAKVEAELDVEAAPEPAQQKRETPSEAIGGMATIDAGEPDEALLVEAEEPAKQPRKNGDGRRRRVKSPADELAPTAEADANPEAQAEG